MIVIDAIIAFCWGFLTVVNIVDKDRVGIPAWIYSALLFVVSLTFLLDNFR